jgi:hypothetical protein
MKAISCLIAGIVLAGAAGCASTPSQRIAAHQAEFSSWPPAIQARVQAGQVAAGFTPGQVLVALGNPDSRTLMTTTRGTTEVWIYNHESGLLSFGIGGGGFSGHSGYGVGFGASNIPIGESSHARVFFTNGVVSAVETYGR